MKLVLIVFMTLVLVLCFILGKGLGGDIPPAKKVRVLTTVEDYTKYYKVVCMKGVQYYYGKGTGALSPVINLRTGNNAILGKRC